MKRIFILLTLLILIFTSCSNNVYIDENIDNPEKEIKKIWRVEDKYFETANDAISYIMNQSQSRSTSRAIDESRTIVLTRHVLSPENELGDDYKEYIEDDNLRGSINVPSDFTGDLVIDFNEKRYDFSNTCKAFFVIEGGDNVKIYNGTSVIYDKASHEPYAISVDTKTVTIDDHLLDDRRVNNKLIYVGENGHLRINNVNPGEGENTLSGEISLITDGKTGALLEIENSTVILTKIYTKYKSSDGTLSNTIDVEIPASARSVINIHNGDVTIKAINQKTDYYNSTTTSIFDKAVLNTLGTKENTTVRSAHDIHDTVDEAIKKSGDNAKHEIWHNMTYHPRKENSCIADGNKEYWTCDGAGVCRGRYYTKEDGSEWTGNWDDIVVLKDPNAHSLEHIEAKAATCTENGNIEYWYCTHCERYFSDAQATTVMTKEDTVIPHHIVLEEWEYDIDNHWHVCTVDGYRVGTALHSWGEWKEHKSGSVTHLFAECSICGARKVAQKPEYLVYNIGIGEVKLKAIEDTPCGDFYINNKKVESESKITVDEANVTIEFRPYLGSKTDYTACSYIYNNGKKEVKGTKKSNGYYRVNLTLTEKTEYVVNIQIKTGGGNLGFDCYINFE